MAFPGIPYDAKEIYIIDQFIYGLGNQELKKHVKFIHPKTLDHAISLAVEFESFEGSQNTLSKPHTVNAVHTVDKPHPNLDCVQNNTLEIIQKQIVEGFKNLSEALHTKNNNGEQTEKRKYQRVPKCYYCGKPGHILKHCRSKIRDESNKSYAPQIPSPRSNTPGTSVSESRTSQAENSEN